jgi:dihydroorotase-like cyclic amidohydrolase
MSFDFKQGGTVVNHDREFLADVLIEDGLIKAVGPDLEVSRASYKCEHYCGNNILLFVCPPFFLVSRSPCYFRLY